MCRPALDKSVNVMVSIYQSMEGWDGEDSQATESGLGGPSGSGQQALRIGRLAALQAGQVTAHPEQLHIKLLQILLPLLDLHSANKNNICFSLLLLWSFIIMFLFLLWPSYVLYYSFHSWVWQLFSSHSFWNMSQKVHSYPRQCACIYTFDVLIRDQVLIILKNYILWSSPLCNI